MSRPAFCISYLRIDKNRPPFIILLACRKKFNMLNPVAIMSSRSLSYIRRNLQCCFQKNKSRHQLLKTVDDSLCILFLSISVSPLQQRSPRMLFQPVRADHEGSFQPYLTDGICISTVFPDKRHYLADFSTVSKNQSICTHFFSSPYIILYFSPIFQWRTRKILFKCCIIISWR